MNENDGLDFLDGSGDLDEVQAAAERAAVEAVRAPMLDWAARTLAARVPQASVYRGNKGIAQCRLDLDRHLKAALEDPADAAQVRYRQWALTAIWLPRGSSPAQFDAGLHTLAESLVRFAAWPHGPRIAARLANNLGERDPQLQMAIAQRCTSG